MLELNVICRPAENLTLQEVVPVISIASFIFKLADSSEILAQRLALVGLAIIAAYHVDEVMKASGSSGYLPITNPMMRSALFEVPAVVLSAAAFALSSRASIFVSLILLLTGSITTLDGIAIGTRYLSVLTIPGPIIGLFYGLGVLSLGLAKAIMTASVFRTPPLAKKRNDSAKCI